VRQWFVAIATPDIALPNNIPTMGMSLVGSHTGTWDKANRTPRRPTRHTAEDKLNRTTRNCISFTDLGGYHSVKSLLRAIKDCFEGAEKYEEEYQCKYKKRILRSKHTIQYKALLLVQCNYTVPLVLIGLDILLKLRVRTFLCQGPK
jgi:hypothetical protein